MTYIQTSVMQAKNVRPTWCLSEVRTSGCLMRCSVGQALDGSKPISRACVERRNSSNRKLWRETNSSHGALLLLYMCLPHGSPPSYHICIKCVSVGQRSHAARACKQAFQCQTSPRAVICHCEQQRGGTAATTAAWLGREKGVWNGVRVLGTQYHKQFKGHRKEGGN